MPPAVPAARGRFVSVHATLQRRPLQVLESAPQELGRAVAHGAVVGIRGALVGLGLSLKQREVFLMVAARAGAIDSKMRVVSLCVGQHSRFDLRLSHFDGQAVEHQPIAAARAS
jgi:hypothetical protein